MEPVVQPGAEEEQETTEHVNVSEAHILPVDFHLHSYELL